MKSTNQDMAYNTFKTRVFFNVMRIMQKRGWNEVDVNYWKDKGWTKSVHPWK